MDLASLQAGSSHSLAAGHQQSAGDSSPTGCSSSGTRQSISGLSGKVAGQRLVDWYGDSGSARSGTEYSGAPEFDVSLTIDSSGADAPDADQSRLEPQQNDGDGPWQVVTRRRHGRTQQQAPVVTPVGDVRLKCSTRAKNVSAGQLPDNRSAGSRTPGKKEHLLASEAGSAYWPLCIKSFAQLSKVKWAIFRSCQYKFQLCQRKQNAMDDFLCFHRTMTLGPQAISRTEDVLSLIRPLKVMMSCYEWLPEAVFLSLIFERAVPGFLIKLGELFVSGLSWIGLKHGELFTATSELLAQICQKDECLLDRLGWKKLSLRPRCQLFSSAAFMFKHAGKTDLIRSLHQQVGGSWMETYHYDTVQKFCSDSGCRDTQLRDLKASVCAIFYWLEGRFFVIPESGERHRLIASYAGVVESINEVMGVPGLQTDGLLFGLLQSVAKWSIRFRKHLSLYLGADRAITLLDGLLQHFHHYSELDKHAFELRLTLLETVLVKCERLLLKRDSVLISQAWCQHEKMLRLMLAESEQFMSDYQPPFPIQSQSALAERKEQARLSLLLKQSAFYRLDCEVRKSSRQQIQKNLQLCRRAFADGRVLEPYYREQGTLELAKWHFLAGQTDAGLNSLMKVHFEYCNLSLRKAGLLADHGGHRAALEEYHHARAMTTDPHERDAIDDRIAMSHFQLYGAEKNTDHLINAYRLSVSLLGRCDIQYRQRFEGALMYIVNAMKKSGLRFENYVGQTSVLDFLVKDGGGIRSWHHFSNLLYIRHKLGLTSADSVNKVADEICVRQGFFLGLDKMI